MGDFDAAFEVLPMPTALVRVPEAGSATVVAVNAAFVKLIGRSASSVVGADLAVVLPGVRTRSKTSGAGSGAERGRAWFLDGVGRRVPVSYELGRTSADVGLLAVQIREVDPSSEADRAVRQSARLLEDVADNVTALIYLKRADGKYLFTNRHYEDLLRQPRGVIVGKPDTDLWPPDIAEVYMANDRAVFATGHPMEFEEPIPTDDGWGMWLSLKFPLFDSDGVIYGVGGISTDISARTRAQAAIQEARDEAERANRAKDEFLSRMSHELRTPLNSILGFGQLLQMEGLSPLAAADVDHVVKAGSHLLSLINEILDMTRLESGAPVLKLERLCACEPVGEAYEMVRPLAADRGIELAMDLHTAMDRYVRADRQRLKQVVLNLLVNAVKYNRPEGMVTVTTRVDDECELCVLVTDTGVGIAPDDWERVFVPFERLGNMQTETEGTGLGLTLARSFTVAMGGELSIERSTPGRGTVFALRLPLTESPSLEQVVGDAISHVPADGVADLKGRTILYIEDNPVNLELVRRILERSGAPLLLAATTGQSGIQLAMAHRPDLILLDLHLPDLDGSQVLLRVRSDDRTRGIPVIVLSADATIARRGQLVAAGAIDYLTKPIDVDDFLTAVSQALHTRTPS